MPDLAIRYLALTDLTPYPKNARTHSPEQVQQIAASIAEFGFVNPVLIDEHNTIIAGHGRAQAAQSLGMAQVPAITLEGLTAAQKRALRIADNKLALNAGWSDELLKAELIDLKIDGFDLGLTGFSELELSDLLTPRTDGLTDPDEVPEAPPDPVSRQGDVWCMGRHRLMCGDSTNPMDVSVLSCGKLADLCFTSPPYLQQRNYTEGAGDWDTLMEGVFTALPVKDEAQLLVNLGLVHRDGEWLPYWDGWIGWMREQGWKRFGWYVWDQGFGLPGDWNGRLAPSHEWVFHFNRVAEQARKSKPKNPENIKARTRGASTMRGRDGITREFTSPEASAQTHKIPDSVIRVTRQVGKVGEDLDHPAVFPVDLVSEMLTAFSDPDDIVYEPFCGSGTQLISAQKNGRTCLAMEIAPQYVDVAIQRWQNFTGQEATLEYTGKTYEEMQNDRAMQEVDTSAAL